MPCPAFSSREPSLTPPEAQKAMPSYLWNTQKSLFHSPSSKPALGGLKSAPGLLLVVFQGPGSTRDQSRASPREMPEFSLLSHLCSSMLPLPIGPPGCTPLPPWSREPAGRYVTQGRYVIPGAKGLGPLSHCELVTSGDQGATPPPAIANETPGPNHQFPFFFLFAENLGGLRSKMR